MWTNYIKNFSRNEFETICKRFDSACLAKTPLWSGTVFIGIEPLYIECHVKWIADKIDEYFVNTLPNQHIDNARELYILNDGVSKFMPQPAPLTTDVFWIKDDIYSCPDIIALDNCIFAKYGNSFFVSVDDNDKNNFWHLGENHLLMRLFGYIFNDNNIVLHGAVVGNKDFGVLITGLSGVGKSTLAAYCAKYGMSFVCDDRVALHIENNIVFADPIYTTLSLYEPIDGLKVKTVFRPENCTKDIIILDKSYISKHMPIRAIIEPIKSNNNMPIIEKSAKSPVLTRICSDYSNFSRLTRSINPLNEYKKISEMLKDIDVYSLQLSKSIDENAKSILNLTLTEV